MAVLAKKNIVISGGTGTGKTTILNLLSSFIPNDERIVTVEDTAELRMQQEHVVRLEARPANIEGQGQVTIRDLVKNCLRMRPDRIVVGECRGGEALDMLQAMNTGHDGSLTTIHANTPRDAFTRLETLCLMAGMDLPVWALREQIRSAVHLVVQLSRLQDGSRKVICITEVTGRDDAAIQSQDLFRFVQDGVDAEGKVFGHYEATGLKPLFFNELKSKGLALDAGIFEHQNDKGRI
jgi:pilus assembly protein CpaF